MLSYRLQCVAKCVEKSNLVADIGTDHGYIPIWLIKNNFCNKAIAADISKGSCDKAAKNINFNNLSDKIDVRCGNGLSVINNNCEVVDCVVISGMGGLLMVDILKNFSGLDNTKQLVLQPQKDLHKVREFVVNYGFTIKYETMIKDNNKFYTIISAIKGKQENLSKSELYFGKQIIKEKSPILKEYIAIEMNKLFNAISNLKINLNDNNTDRYNDLKEEFNMYMEVFKCL
jgi:predicted SAM-dependent methyltransferase